MLQQDDVETINYKHVNRGIGENDERNICILFLGSWGGWVKSGWDKSDGWAGISLEIELVLSNEYGEENG